MVTKVSQLTSNSQLPLVDDMEKNQLGQIGFHFLYIVIIFLKLPYACHFRPLMNIDRPLLFQIGFMLFLKMKSSPKKWLKTL